MKVTFAQDILNQHQECQELNELLLEANDRLKQGQMSKETIYSEDPQKMAMKWYEEGAERLHLVDLDGAVEGKPINEIMQVDAEIDLPRATHLEVKVEQQRRVLIRQADGIHLGAQDIVQSRIEPFFEGS